VPPDGDGDDDRVHSGEGDVPQHRSDGTCAPETRASSPDDGGCRIAAGAAATPEGSIFEAHARQHGRRGDGTRGGASSEWFCYNIF